MSDKTPAESFITESLDGAQKNLDKLFGEEKLTTEQQLVHVLSLNHRFTIAALLESIRRLDPVRADEMATWLSDQLEAGDTVGEMVWQWRDELKRGHHLTMVGPTLTQPAPPADARPVQVLMNDGQFEVLGVSTGTPGLVVTQDVIPALTSGEQHRIRPGTWGVTHEPSGLKLAFGRRVSGNFPLDVAKAMAARLGELGIDWTQPRETVATGDSLRRWQPVFDEFEGCQYHTDADHLPVPEFRQAVAAND